jgi:glycosyltransferase involved in cell wall biosynthesis
MKILIIASLYPPYVKGGGEISTQLLAEGLKKIGIDVVVVSIDEKYKEEFINGVKIYRIPTPNIYWSFKSHQQSKIKKIVWHMIDSYNIFIEKDLSKILQKEKPDIVHSSTIEDISAYSWKVAKNMGFKVIHTLRSYTLLCPHATMFKNNKNCDSQCLNCKYMTYPKKILSNYVDGVVGISNFILEKHIQNGYFPKALKNVIYNPISTNQIKRTIKKQNIVLGFLGRLEQAKGIEFLLEKYSKLNLPNTQLLIFGKGVNKEYENNLKVKYNQNYIIFKGFMKPEEIYPQIDILIVPSLWNEPFGRIVPEANSYGIPVLVSNKGGLPELVQEGKNGYVFDSDTKDDFKEKLDLIIKKYKEQDFKFDITQFKQENIIKGYINVYKKL